MTKPIKYTIAIVLRDPHDMTRFLVVKRPATDPELGLPAATLLPVERPDVAAATTAGIVHISQKRTNPRYTSAGS